MKKITMLLIALFVAAGVFAQTEVTPAQVIFNCGDKKVTLKEAKTEGVQLPQSLEIEVVFSDSETAKLNSENVTFEFRWFYYMSTKKTLMATNTIAVDSAADNDGLVRVVCEKKNARKGWWEVQVKCKTNDSPVVFAGTKEFSILLK